MTPAEYTVLHETVFLDPATGDLHVRVTLATFVVDPERYRAALAAFAAAMGMQLVCTETRHLPG